MARQVAGAREVSEIAPDDYAAGLAFRASRERASVIAQNS
jgi:hypothetical protein